MKFFKSEDCDIMIHKEDCYALAGISFDKASRLFEEWLAKGIMVYSSQNQDRAFTQKKYRTDTHCGVIVNIEPIKQDSLEKVLTEIVALRKAPSRHLNLTKELDELIDRTYKLLEKQK